MKTSRHKKASRPAPSGELAELRARLADAEQTLRAIRSGEVDAVVVAGKRGPQVFTLEGAGHAYRLLIESMYEGALRLTAQGVILYANRCFARMVKRPLEQVMGSALRRFLSPADQAAPPPLIKQAGKSGATIQVQLKARDGSQMPVQISFCPLAKRDANRATIGMVVTDMTAAWRTEQLLRTLTHRVVQAQEAERARVALDLHDNITQMLCAIRVRSEVLVDKLSECDGSPKQDAIKLRERLGQTAEAVECISRYLRPSGLEHLGLAAVLRATGKEFAERTGGSAKVACVKLAARLRWHTAMRLFRILQEALRNVEQHARAHHVTVCLKQQGGFIYLTINDDGIGFAPERHVTRRKGRDSLGLLGMRERATSVGGNFKIKSVRGAGTEIEVLIPLGKVRPGARAVPRPHRVAQPSRADKSRRPAPPSRAATRARSRSVGNR